MSPRKKIARMLLVALGVIAICCVLLRASSCSGANADGKSASANNKLTTHSRTI